MGGRASRFGGGGAFLPGRSAPMVSRPFASPSTRARGARLRPGQCTFAGVGMRIPLAYAHSNAHTAAVPKPTAALPEDDDELVRVHLEIKARGLRYVDARAAEIGKTRTDVIRLALGEYKERHPLLSDRPARPVPKTKEKT